MINSVTIEGVVIAKPVFRTIGDKYSFYELSIKNTVTWKDQTYETIVPLVVWKQDLFEQTAQLEEEDHITISGKVKVNYGKSEKGYMSIQVKSFVYGSKPKDDLVQKSYKKQEKKNYLWGDKHTDEEKLDAQNVLRGAKRERSELIVKAEKHLEDTKDGDMPF